MQKTRIQRLLPAEATPDRTERMYPFVCAAYEFVLKISFKTTMNVSMRVNRGYCKLAGGQGFEPR